MLSMNDIKYIKRMHDCEGVSIREIMRRTGYHYETITKYLDMEDFNNPLQPPKELPSLLDPLKPIIDEWLYADTKAPRKQRHTAKRIFDRLQEEYHKDLHVKYRTVQYYVSKKKKEIYKLPQKSYLPLYHPPGEAQVDFGHFSYYNNLGEMIDALKLTVSFPYSNHAYCQIFGGENQECLLQGMKNIFEHIGLVPYRMVFDNLSAAVAHMGKGHDRKLTEGFKRFITHYNIDAVFCNGAAGWEKGNVENKVGYERRNMFVPVPTIPDFTSFNKNLFCACEKDAKRKHYKKERSIEFLFHEDKKAMRSLNTTAFDVHTFVSRITDKYAKVSFDKNLYSSSPKYTKDTVYIKATSDKVYILNPSYEIIMTHPRLYGNGLESMNWLPYLSVMANRPTAIKYTSFYGDLPDNWRKYLNKQDQEGKRKGLLALQKMLSKHDMQIATGALNFAIENGVQDTESILAGYRKITSNTKQLQPLQLKSTIIKMPVFIPDNEKYDHLIGQEVLS